MKKSKSISINYEPSDTIERQGKRKDIDKYLKIVNNLFCYCDLKINASKTIITQNI